MTIDDPMTPVAPDPVTARSLGILQVVFGLGLMAMGMCWNLYAMIPTGVSFAIQQKLLSEAKDEAARAKLLAELRDRQANAIDADKATLGNQIATLEAESLQKLPPEAAKLADPRLRSPTYVGFVVLDLGSGLILNLLMLISGVGILYRRGWGRWLGVGVSWLKILRLLAVAAVIVFLLAPAVGRTIADLMAQALNNGPGVVLEAERAGRHLGWAFAAYGVVLLVVGAIYPAVVIRLLNRPAVRAALSRQLVWSE